MSEMAMVLDGFKAMKGEVSKEIGGLRQEMNEGFKKVDNRFDAVDRRFDEMGEFLEESFGAIKESFTEMESRFDGVDMRFDSLDTRMTTNESAVARISGNVEAITNHLGLPQEKPPQVTKVRFTPPRTRGERRSRA